MIKPMNSKNMRLDRAGRAKDSYRGIACQSSAPGACAVTQVKSKRLPPSIILVLSCVSLLACSSHETAPIVDGGSDVTTAADTNVSDRSSVFPDQASTDVVTSDAADVAEDAWWRSCVRTSGFEVGQCCAAQSDCGPNCCSPEHICEPCLMK
jgi:hypothetical protein